MEKQHPRNKANEIGNRFLYAIKFYDSKMKNAGNYLKEGELM